MPRIAIVVGEASGDQLGRGLIEALRQRCPDAEFVGVTGPQMRAAGCVSWSDYQPLAIMGLVEVLRHIPGLWRLQRMLKKRLRDERPDVLVGIDAPDFNLRLETYARKLGIPAVHYVCPSVWAWRQGRVKTIRRACDRVLCLLPFEAGFLQEHDVDGVFVGHPLADEIGAGQTVQESRTNLEWSVDSTDQCVALLPGSRAAEINLLAPPFLATVSWLLERRPQLRFTVAAANNVIAVRMAELIAEKNLTQHIRVFAGSTRDVLGAADAVLLASGTATLETMLMRRPMVVAYRMNALTAWLVRRLAKAEFAALPNLLAGRALVPEFLQEAVVPEALGEALLHWLDRAEARESLRNDFDSLCDSLRRDASARSADAVLEIVDQHSASRGDIE